MNAKQNRISMKIRSALRIICVSCLGLAGQACASLDYANPDSERTVRVLTEEAVRLTFINDHEFGGDVGDEVYVESGDLQIYFNVSLPQLTAENMGVTIAAGGSDTLLVCAGSLVGIERPSAFRLQNADVERAKKDVRTRVALCDRLTRR